MTKNEDLKACPFCGGEGEYYQPNEDIVVIACLTCNAESGYYDGEDSTTLDDAVKFWNTRNGKLTRPTQSNAPSVPMEALQGVREALEKHAVNWTYKGEKMSNDEYKALASLDAVLSEGK